MLRGLEGKMYEKKLRSLLMLCQVEIEGRRHGGLQLPHGGSRGMHLSLLCSVFVNDLDARIKVILSKFAGDTKLAGAISSLEDGEVLRRDLDKLEDEAATKCVKYIKKQCWFLHLG